MSPVSSSCAVQRATRSQAFLVCRLDAAGRRVLTLQRWGLVPSWARDRAIGNRLINARSETVDGLRMARNGS